MLNITMKHNLKTVTSYATHYSCWKMCFSSVVYCTVIVFAIYLTLLLITKKIIKYRLQQFTSVMNSETICTCHLKHISSQTSSKYKKQELYYQTFLWVAFMATVCVCIYIYIYINKKMQTIIVLQYHDTILMIQTVQKFWFTWIYFQIKKKYFFITGTFWTNEWLLPLSEELYPRVFSPDPLCTGMVQAQGGQLAGLSSVNLSSWYWLQ